MLDRVTGMQVFAKVAALGSLSATARANDTCLAMASRKPERPCSSIGADNSRATARQARV